MKFLRRRITDYQIITEFDKEEAINNKVKIWANLGYKPLGGLHQSVVRFSSSNQSIVYTQVMVMYHWRWGY
jgi:hypothetical protein